MPTALQPIPIGTKIVEPRTGAITIFFREAWEALRAAIASVPSLGSGVDLTLQNTALASQVIYTTTVAGIYRVSYYIRKTAIDGAASSVGFVWHWTESGVPLTLTDTALVTDTTGAVASNSKLLAIDANTNITYDTSYASTTPGQMKYRITVRVEQVN